MIMIVLLLLRLLLLLWLLSLLLLQTACGQAGQVDATLSLPSCQSSQYFAETDMETVTSHQQTQQLS